MKAVVTDDCIACEACVNVCPEVFEMNEAGDKAQPKMESVPDDLQDKAHVACEACPVDAIILEEE